MRIIYISPHLDDAVLSAGGYLYEQAQAGISVEIWTIICGYPPPGELTPFAQYLHQEWKTGSAQETVRHRRGEDRKAARIVGAKSVHFDVPDCIYRRRPDGEPLYQGIYVQPHDAEAELVDQIAESIEKRLDSGDRIICQLGVGGHVDHVIVRDAVEKLNRPLKYTADLPYLFWQPETLAPLVTGMSESRHPITEAGLQAWIEAVLAYESQLSTLFESATAMETEIRSFYAERDG
jgi:LmbE family N-acetylglucosaminyl deacetylase